jgi:hypothetical protein
MATLRDLAATTKARIQLCRIAEEATHNRTVGVSVLFAGNSALARMAAAEAMATEAALPLHRIDLRGVVSKYIGETEKNLGRIFDAAEGRPAVLFFDEADALLGKHTTVTDAHDRYGHMEVNYLLQRIEGYRGLAIFGARRRAGFAPALLRMARCIVELEASAAETKGYVPDLAATVDQAIQSIQLRALAVIYFAAMLEALKGFRVVDRLVERFASGALPLATSNAGKLLSHYARQEPSRWSEAERRDLYGRAFGIPGGDDGVIPNREFDALWIRFISCVSSWGSQQREGAVASPSAPVRGQQNQLREAGRALAVNLSLHGCGISLYAATELREQIHALLAILSAPDLLGTYGARDRQVVDQVASLELGGARNAVRYATMAASGAAVIAWLSNHLGVLSRAEAGPVLLMDASPHACRPLLGARALTNPTESDLVNACEQWLAVACAESQAEDLAQPIEPPATQGAVVQLPALARQLLEAIGVAEESVSGAARTATDHSGR